MLSSAVTRRVQSIVFFSVCAMTLVVTPWFNLDPINLPKFLLLIVCSLTSLGYLLPQAKNLSIGDVRLLAWFVLIFIAGLFLSFVLSGSGVLAQLFGQYGRNTGLLAYLAMSSMCLVVAVISNKNFASRLVWVLIATGAVNAVYGFVQWAGVDPIAWSESADRIFGTLGNSNFLSAHLGIASLAALALLLGGGVSTSLRVLMSLGIGLAMFVVYQSKSIQGLMVFLLCASIVVYFRFVARLRFSFLKYLYWAIFVVGSAFGVVGVLNKGPLAPILYQESVTFRGDYWRAGLNMTLDHPIFGVGLDSYGDWYRFSRTEAAALRRGPDITSNSAHNVFLDISSSGGFILLIGYLLIFGLVLKSALRILRKSSSYDAVGVGLASTWAAYNLQSIISINQLGLAIWGWVLGGAIIGYDVFGERSDTPPRKVLQQKNPELTPASSVLSGTLGIVLGIALAIWPVVQDVSFRRALEKSDALAIQKATNQFPRNNYYYVAAGSIFSSNKLDDRSLEMARKALAANPRDFGAWKILVANPKLSDSERASAIAKMKELDPFNNTLGD